MLSLGREEPRGARAQAPRERTVERVAFPFLTIQQTHQRLPTEAGLETADSLPRQIELVEPAAELQEPVGLVLAPTNWVGLQTAVSLLWTEP